MSRLEELGREWARCWDVGNMALLDQHDGTALLAVARAAEDVLACTHQNPVNADDNRVTTGKGRAFSDCIAALRAALAPFAEPTGGGG